MDLPNKIELTIEEIDFIIEDVITSSEYAYTKYYNTDDIIIAVKRLFEEQE